MSLFLGNGKFELQNKTSRDLGTLLPKVRARVVAFMAAYTKATGLDLLCYCTQRSTFDQQAAFNSGASKAKPGESWHQWGCAADIVPLIGGKPLWTVFDKKKIMLPEWEAYGKIATDCDLEWAGNWKSFKEYNHVQYTASLRIQDVVANTKLLEKLL